MNFQVSEGEKYQKVLTIEVSLEDMEPALAATCKKLAQQVRIPGFRKGKIPRPVLENYVGKDAILVEASEDIMNDAYGKALQESGVLPCTKPEVDIVTMKAGEPLCFTATVTVYPEVKLGQYKELPVTRVIIDVDDQAVDEALEELRDRYSSMKAALEDDVVGEGDIVTIDYKGTKDGVAFEGGTATNYQLEIGSHSFIPGFEEAIVGMKAHETKVIPLTFPADYHAAELAGAAVEFEVTVQQINKKVRLELTDPEFIEQASETANTLEELRAEVKERLLEQSKEQATNQARSTVLLKVIETSEMDVPPVMVEQQLDMLVGDIKNNMAQEGIKIEDYISQTGGSMEELRDTYRERALMNVKREMIVTEIMKKEDIRLSEEELKAEFDKLGKAYGLDGEQIQMMLYQNGALEDFINSMHMQKAADLIYDTAIVTDEYVSQEEYAKRTTEAAAIASRIQEAQKQTDAEASDSQESAAADTVEEESKDAE